MHLKLIQSEHIPFQILSIQALQDYNWKQQFWILRWSISVLNIFIWLEELKLALTIQINYLSNTSFFNIIVNAVFKWEQYRCVYLLTKCRLIIQFKLTCVTLLPRPRQMFRLQYLFWNRPWWPSGLERHTISGVFLVSLMDPSSNPASAEWKTLTVFGV